MSAYKRFVSGPKPIGSLTPEEIDAKLTKGRLYFLMADMSLIVTIARRAGVTPYHVRIEDGQEALYHKQYATLAQLMEQEPFDLAKFSYERK